MGKWKNDLITVTMNDDTNSHATESVGCWRGKAVRRRAAAAAATAAVGMVVAEAKNYGVT